LSSMGAGAKSKGFAARWTRLKLGAANHSTPRPKAMNERIYLDWNAAAPLREEARAAALAAFDLVGNPSSVHGEGRAARHLIEQAREPGAARVGAAPRTVVFTSGGTEANMLALVPTAARDRLLVSAIEHPSVLAGGRFPAGSVEQLPVTGSGEVDL